MRPGGLLYDLVDYYATRFTKYYRVGGALDVAPLSEFSRLFLGNQAEHRKVIFYLPLKCRLPGFGTSIKV